MSECDCKVRGWQEILLWLSQFSVRNTSHGLEIHSRSVADLGITLREVTGFSRLSPM